MAETHENWRRIPGFSDYEASDAGRVRSWRRATQWPHLRSECRDVALAFNKKGYALAGVYADGIRSKRRTAHVHHLVLEAFVGPRPDGMECRHKNGVRSDNRLTNLEWSTPLENAADRERHGTTARGERGGMSKLSDAAVLEMRAMRLKGSTWRETGARFLVSERAARRAVLGHSWKHIKEAAE